MKLRRGKLTLEEREACYGYLFLVPWALGFVFLFLGPLVTAIRMTFSKVAITNKGFSMDFVGLTNYINILTKESDFYKGLTNSVFTLLYQLPIITIFSFFIAVVINQKFRGRYFMRMVFFLPVIVASGAAIDVLKSSIAAQQLGGSSSGTIYNSIALTQIMIESGFPNEMVSFVSRTVNQSFDLIWKCGIQILLFLAGLQSIAPQYYEAADVEGATGWEKFWKITFPLISPITLTVLFYTVVDSFLDFSNYVMKLIYWAQGQNLQFERSTTMATIYFIVIFVICGILLAAASRWVFYHDEK